MPDNKFEVLHKERLQVELVPPWSCSGGTFLRLYSKSLQQKLLSSEMGFRHFRLIFEIPLYRNQWLLQRSAFAPYSNAVSPCGSLEHHLKENITSCH
eukprot:3859129-Amphidinium_carterae.1